MTAMAANVKCRGDGGGGRHDHCAGASSRAPPPLQPRKNDPVAGVAVSVTTVPLSQVAEQLVSHVIPAGVIVTVPLPLAARVTVTAKGTSKSKVAVTIVTSDMVTVQTSVPTHAAPLQPVKIEFFI